MHPYYYIRNGQNDVIGLFDANGTIVARYTYDSWGNLLKITDGSGNDKTNDTAFIGYKNPIRYRGYYYDSETKLYYLQSRYYNPEWGRFINADGIIGANGDLVSNNLFSYCGNNPVNRADPSGLFWEKLFDIIEAAAKVVSQVAAKAAASAAAAAAKSITAGVIKGGSVYRTLPNGLASALTAKSNTLSTISSSTGTLGKIAGAAAVGFAAVDVSVKVINNFNNDNLSLSRKISDSVVDAGVTAGSIWAAGAIGASVGTAIPIPGVGTAVGFVAGVGVGLIVDHTPVVGWVKDGAGWVADKVGGFFGSLFG